MMMMTTKSTAHFQVRVLLILLYAAVQVKTFQHASWPANISQFQQWHKLFLGIFCLHASGQNHEFLFSCLFDSGYAESSRNFSRKLDSVVRQFWARYISVS